jgi:hypothetical protein
VVTDIQKLFYAERKEMTLNKQKLNYEEGKELMLNTTELDCAKGQEMIPQNQCGLCREEGNNNYTGNGFCLEGVIII